MFGTYWFLLTMVTLSVSLAVGGLWLVRRFVDHQTLMGHHDVAGYMLSVVGTLYAVVLGLIVVGSLNKFEQARLNVDQEANSLSDIFHLAKALPKADAVQIRRDCLDYANVVITDEWKTMELGGHSIRAHLTMADLWKQIGGLKPSNSGESNLHAALLSELDDLGDHRHSRLLEAKGEIDPMIWFTLIVGGCVLVVFTYFFGLPKFAVQAMMTAFLTVVLSLNMVVVALFGTPYSGDVKVSSDAFSAAIRHFNQELVNQEP